jgi:hypothetical protein
LLSADPPILMVPGGFDGMELSPDEVPDGVGVLATLEVHPKPTGFPHVIDAGRYEVDLFVTAADTPAVAYRVSIEFDGKWERGPGFWRRLRIGQSERL